MERKLGNLELYSAYRNVLQMMPMVIVSASYSTFITKSQLYSALTDVIIKNPILSTNVFDISSDTSKPIPILKQILNIDLNLLVEFKDNIDLESFVNLKLSSDEGAIDYNDATRPAWRLYVLSNKHEQILVWGFDHGIYDGNSGATFHIKLLNSLNSLPPANNIVDSPNNLIKLQLISNDQQPLPKCLEDIINVKPSMMHLLKTLYSEYFGKNKKSLIENLPAVRKPYKSQSIFFDIAPDTLGKLLTKARSMDATLTGLLTALHIKSINAYLEATSTIDDMANREAIYSCPINARRYFSDNEGGESLGNYVSAYDHPMIFSDIKNQSINNISEKFSSSLKKSLASNELVYLCGMLGYVDIREYLIKAVEKGSRRVLGEISNLGNVGNNQSTGKFTINKLVFVQAASSAGAPFLLNCVSVPGGPLAVTMTVADDDNSKTVGKQLKEYFLQYIEQVLNP